MYYGGRPEPEHRVPAALGAVAGAIAGAVVAYFAFLPATLFPHLLHTALPGMTHAWFLALWFAALAVPMFWFRTVWTGGRGIGTKGFAACGCALIALLFVGELSGTVRVFPWDTRVYLVPAIDRPDPTPSARRPAR